MAEAVLFVELVPTTTGIKRNVEKELNGTFDTVEKRGSSVFSKIGGFAKGAALAAAGAAATLTGIAVKGGFDRMLKIEDATAKLDGLGHSAESVDQIMGSALAAVRGTAFGLDAAATVAASAVAAGIKPGAELEKYLRLTADAATIAGTSLDEMGAIINKATAGQTVYTDTLNQLQDRGIPILQWLADEYGVTAAAMSKMVSDGKVDAATFRNVIEKNIGGAALRSGETTRGAWANMLAALSRVGVALLENVFPYFKTTFQGITRLLDEMTTRIGPFADKFSALISLMRSGDFTAQMRELTGWEEDAPVVRAVMNIRDALTGLFNLLIKGDYTSALRNVFAMEEDSPLTVALLAARDAAVQLGPTVLGLVQQFSPLVVILGILGPLLPTLLPPLVDLATVALNLANVVLPVLVEFLTQVATVVAGVAVSAVPLLVGALNGLGVILGGVVGFLGQFSGLLGPITVAVLAGVVAFKTYAAVMAAWKVVAAAYAGLQSVIIAATYGQIGATYAQAGASQAAAIAQRLLNAAMTANPIGLIITAIAALVAGLVWFFTQTELGQQIWANVTAAIAAAATWLWENVLQPVFTAIGEIFTWVYENIIMPVVIGIMLYIGLWAAAIQALWEGVLSPVFGLIGEVFTWIYENVILPIVGLIVAQINAWATVITWLYESVIVPVFAALGAAFTFIYENIIAPIAAAIGQAIQFVGDTIHNVFTGIADFVGAAFQATLSVVRGPLNALIGLINSVIDGLNSIQVDIPDWVPLVGGSTFSLGIPNIPQLEDGALVKARAGGVIANIGEGRYDEVVLPLSPSVLSQVGGGSGGGTINVYPQPGQSEEEIGRAAGRYQARQARRSVA
ncbi:tape measure protein [Microbacterium sp. Kw_RZR3]|uniref:tape measure protein n=1 Tax=Microbacterium sp. Kw_RZR3 TaxID=3032903 RepID=UPI0023D98669|nr:tape measure protein [Microbacterium sp. Kw_RZR3]MDF2045154.1 tape measure protein [Microbacterium sp. Kw_RZR3]